MTMSNAADRSRRIRTEERDEALAVARARQSQPGEQSPFKCLESECGQVRVELIVLLEKRKELVKNNLFQSFGQKRQ